MNPAFLPRLVQTAESSPAGDNPRRLKLQAAAEPGDRLLDAAALDSGIINHCDMLRALLRLMIILREKRDPHSGAPRPLHQLLIRQLGIDFHQEMQSRVLLGDLHR